MRFFRFIKNFSKAWDSLLNEDGMRMLINVGKSGFMGAYLGCEFFSFPSPPLLYHYAFALSYSRAPILQRLCAPVLLDLRIFRTTHPSLRHLNAPSLLHLYSLAPLLPSPSFPTFRSRSFEI